MVEALLEHSPLLEKNLPQMLHDRAWESLSLMGTVHG